MQVENIRIYNEITALWNMRNAMKSNVRSDSFVVNRNVIIGENDKDLAKKLIKSGTSHRKFCRQIFISAEVTAPLYWWKQFDTYKVGVTANSESTMHTLTKTKKLTQKHFTNCETEFGKQIFKLHLKLLNELLDDYKKNKDIKEKKKIENDLFKLLPDGFLQRRGITFNLENYLNMREQRKNHKLKEWNIFLKDIFFGLESLKAILI